MSTVPELVVKVQGDGDYPLNIEEALADLTGAETVVLEEYLGGWDRFDIKAGNARSVIAIIWLAKRQAGKDVSLEQVAETKGLIFGDAFDLEEVKNGGPPAPAAQDAALISESSSSASTSETSGDGDSSSATG